ncbi:WXG100 family type VII secretion target [Nocardia sp. NPDC003482]
MTRHTIDLELLDSIIARLKGFEGYFDDQLTALDDSVKKLAGVWKGDGATAQRETHDRLMASAREIHEGIKDMRRAAETAHANYSGAIEANLRMWRGGGR